MDQPGKVANPARGQLNRENEHSPVPVRVVLHWDCASHLTKGNVSVGWEDGSFHMLRGVPPGGACWCVHLRLAEIVKI